jgi:hypothetical protein
VADILIIKQDDLPGGKYDAFACSDDPDVVRQSLMPGLFYWRTPASPRNEYEAKLDALQEQLDKHEKAIIVSTINRQDRAVGVKNDRGSLSDLDIGF